MHDARQLVESDIKYGFSELWLQCWHILTPPSHYKQLVIAAGKHFQLELFVTLSEQVALILL